MKAPVQVVVWRAVIVVQTRCKHWKACDTECSKDLWITLKRRIIVIQYILQKAPWDTLNKNLFLLLPIT